LRYWNVELSFFRKLLKSI